MAVLGCVVPFHHCGQADPVASAQPVCCLIGAPDMARLQPSGKLRELRYHLSCRLGSCSRRTLEQEHGDIVVLAEGAGGFGERGSVCDIGGRICHAFEAEELSG